MTDKNILDDIAKKLSEALPESVHEIQKEMQKTFKTILQGAFSKLDLITREFAGKFIVV